MKKKYSFLKGALCGALTAFVLAGVAAGALYLKYADTGEKSNIVKEIVENKNIEETKLGLIKALIDGYYIGDINGDELAEGIYKGYVSGLSDPYSAYYDKEETTQLSETTSGEYSGIGAVMTQDKDSGIITILQVYDGSPAVEAGIHADDILYKVNGQEVTGKDLTSVVGLIKGEEGSTVEITVLRGDQAEEITVTSSRRKIEARTVEYHLREDGIGYIRVTEFDQVTPAQYELALNTLELQGMKGLVVDLRNNPGGNLASVCEMLDLMLPEGLIVYTEDRDGKRKEYTSDAERKFEKPLTVLMNGGSASASEIFAGAIQDYGIGKVVGTQSYGKGVVQQLFDLKDGTCVKLTVAEYFTPNGRNINGEGITPDEVIKYEADANNPEADNQLNKAAEIAGQTE